MQYYHIRTPEYVYAILSHTARLSMCSRYYHIRTPEHVYAILSHTHTGATPTPKTTPNDVQSKIDRQPT